VEKEKSTLYVLKETLFKLQPAIFLFGLGFREVYLKKFFIVSVVLFLALMIISSEWKRLIKPLSFKIVLAFFLLLFLFGVLLPGDFYDNQKYFFYYYPAYFLAFVMGLYWGKREDGQLVIEKTMVLLGLLVSISTLYLAFKAGKFGFWQGRFSHYNLLGMFIGAVSSFVLVASITRRSLIALLFLPLFIFVLVGSYSRGATFSFALSSMITIGLAIAKRHLKWERSLLLPISVAVVFFAIIFGIFYTHSSGMKSRVSQTLHLSLSGREDIWKDVLKKVKVRPLGYGISCVHTVVRNPHNQILAFALGSGVLVSLYFLIMNLWVFFCGVRAKCVYLPGLAMLLFFLFHFLVEGPLVIGIWDNSLLYWFSLGLACSNLGERK